MGRKRFFDIIPNIHSASRPSSTGGSNKDLNKSKIVREDKATEPMNNISIQSDNAQEDGAVYALELSSIKELFYPIHSNRLIALTGRMRDVDSEFIGESSLVKSYEARLEDSTGKILVKWIGGKNFEWDHRNTYRVEGICDTDDFVYLYLKQCDVKVIERPVRYASQTTGVTLTQSSDNSSLVEKGRSPDITAKPVAEPARKSSEANWTREIKLDESVSDTSWEKLRVKVFKRDSHRCVQCGGSENLTVDHIQPLSLGGTNRMDNLQTLCADCHEDKHYMKFLEKGFKSDASYGENYKLSNKMLAVTEAIKAKRSLKIVYTDRKQATSTRSIRPSRIYKGYRYMGKTVCVNCVYIDAYCELEKANRTFRLSRMKRVE